MITIVYNIHFVNKFYKNLHKMVGWFTEKQNRSKCFTDKGI